MELFNNHKRLFTTFTVFFLILTFFVAILPAVNNQNNNAPLPNSVALTKDEYAGKLIYIAEGCVGCHSQQVRNVEIDKVWGSRPGIAADYARITRTSFWQNTATLMGTERTGPDLTNIGVRQPSQDWHLVHLYNPRTVVPQSNMAPYPWLFKIKDSVEQGDVKVNVPAKFIHGKKGVVVARREALQLVAYLQSLKQVKLPDGTPDPDFLYKKTVQTAKDAGTTSLKADGAALFAANCQSCHQTNGEGLKGAFPPLKGSAIVLNDNIETLVGIILNGYDARSDYGVMPAVGTNANLSPEEIAAIINHEKTSWGNNAKKVTPEEVEKIVLFIKGTTLSK
jgi:cytochrome c oxidase cbb3-type subunit 2